MRKGNKMSQLIIVSGPSGVGKSTLVDAVLADNPKVKYFKKVTTRDKRPDDRMEEADFVSLDQYNDLLSSFRIAFPYSVSGNQYGLPIDSFAGLKTGPKIVCQGEFRLIKSLRHVFNAVTIYVTAAPDHIIDRLHKREDTDEQRQRSIDSVAQHLEGYQQHKPLFDYEIVNDKLEDAQARILEIVRNEVLPQKDAYEFLLPRSQAVVYAEQELIRERSPFPLLPCRDDIRRTLETNLTPFYFNERGISLALGIRAREYTYTHDDVVVVFYAKRDKERDYIDFGYFELHGLKRSLVKTKALLEELFPALKQYK